jgi:hypothetical protein
MTKCLLRDMLFKQKNTMGVICMYKLFLLTIVFFNQTLLIQAQPKQLFKRDAGFWTSPTDEEKQGFFDHLTPVESQREDWYAVTPYIAEFWCTISNSGLLGVGLYH